MQKKLFFIISTAALSVTLAAETFSVSNYFESDPSVKSSVKLEKKLTSSGNTTGLYTDPEGGITKLKFDFDGNLVSLNDPENQAFCFAYSFEGKLLSEPDTWGGLYEYKYNSSGFLESFCDESGKVYYEYFPDGRLKSFINSNGEKTEINYWPEGNIYSAFSSGSKIFFHYDNRNRLTARITGPEDSFDSAQYYEKYVYSKDNRKVTCDVGGVYKVLYELDAFGNIVKITDGKNSSLNLVYDSKNRLVSKTDPYGNTVNYSYSVFGKISRMIFADQSSVNYEYDVNGNCVKITDGLGLYWQGNYDLNGNLISEKGRALPQKKYSYDKTGRLIQEENSGVKVSEYKYKNFGRDLTFSDALNNKWSFSKDEFGRPVSEKSPLGFTKEYFYGSDGNLVRSVDSNGNETFYDADCGGKTKRVLYSDGTSAFYEYDMKGNLTRAKNQFSDYSFSYNRAGLLERTFDSISGAQITYSYDDAGNCSGVKTDERDISYEYGKNGELLLIRDNIQKIKISFEYDSLMREVKRTLGNGNQILKNYDKGGRINSIIQKDSCGKLLWAQGYVYNNEGRLYGKVDQTGAITFYEYDKMGRVSKVKYPAKKDVMEKQKKEAEVFGVFVFDNGSGSVSEYLTSEDAALFRKAVSEFGLGQDSVISTLQFYSPESYSYDLCGNLISKKNNYGEILYGYDSENHLKYITVNGEVVADYIQDGNGNLISETCGNKKTVYSYSPENRMISCHKLDLEELTSDTGTFAYDALGRRVLSQTNGSEILRTFYDGRSLNVIKEGPVYQNGTYSSVSGFEVMDSVSGALSERYRFVSDSDISDKTRFKLESDYEKNLESQDSLSFPLYANGQVCAQVKDQNSLYFASDYLGSVISCSDRFGNLTGVQDFDILGNPLSVLEYVTFGYAGKPYDSLTRTYNFGFRDYSPFSASFTTSDPIRDGTNWFSYCNGDPVNFVDLWGLKITDVNSKTHQNDSAEPLGKSSETIEKVGCVFTSYVRMAQELGADITLNEANVLANEYELFHNDNLLTAQAGATLVNIILRKKNINNVRVQFDSRIENKTNAEYVEELQKRESEGVNYFVTGRIKTDNYDHTYQYEHTLNINSEIFETENGLAITYNDTSTADRKSSVDTSRLNEIKNLTFFTVHAVDPYSFDEVDLKTKRIENKKNK